ncbi:c-type cytochrome biogenesis protein CcmI [Roseivivax sediminis]|uniref:Cytochrome c-type biogenesis protein CcmH n=1 Tax=Roseivivax sediminis TaxID=936889 RepID=A0A1I2DJU2_9RHOB|nr:c-type cytochrome biogenesis protein CcmI [Roseivivax sediminis]SFE80885.1 cytochrome c-type biogenesis protein CcmH [Roseivivax sediminis]
MTGFFILTGALALLVAALMALALLRGHRDTRAGEAFDLQVYRDQLKEVERDAARGTIGPEEAERLRTEVSRRLLAADERARAAATGEGQPRTLGYLAAALIVAVVLGGGFGLYAALGAPGYGDLGLRARIAQAEEARAERPSQNDAEAQAPQADRPDASEEYRALVQRLRGAVAERPDDLQGYQLLARSEAALGNYGAAWRAQQKIVELKGSEATAGDHADLGDMMVLAAGGYVSPEAERAFDAALARDPGNGPARYYKGLSYAQTGRPDRAFRIWDRLLRDSAATDPWVDPVQQQIGAMARRAGVNNYQMPQPEGAEPGPSPAEMQAAEDMDPEARAEMIRGMVSRLSDRLQSEGGSPEEWARLIGAYAVLGQAERAMAAFEEAQDIFAGDEAALRTIRQGAQGAGIGQ